MLISEDRKFLFLAVPKTGTTSIEKHLQELEPSVRRNAVPKADGTWVPVHKHARAVEIHEIMGSRMKEYTTIAFIREPTTTVISKYYYYKTGRGAERAKKAKFNIRGTKNKLKTLSAQTLPIRLWALVYPYSMTHEFLLGHDGEILVDEIGHFEDLQGEFVRIFRKLGFGADDLSLPVTNKSTYSATRHTEDNLLKGIVAWKSSVDRRIYDDSFPQKVAVSKDGTNNL